MNKKEKIRNALLQLETFSGGKVKGWKALFLSFSISKNLKKLFKYNSKADYPGLHLLKIVNIIFIIYGHRFIYFIGYPKFYTEAVEMVSSRI